MYRTAILLVLFAVAFSSLGQNMIVSDTGGTPDINAILDLRSETQGLLVPRMTLAQRNAISTPPQGLIIFQTDATTGLWMYDTAASSWELVQVGTANIALDSVLKIGSDAQGDSIYNLDRLSIRTDSTKYALVQIDSLLTIDAFRHDGASFYGYNMFGDDTSYRYLNTGAASAYASGDDFTGLFFWTSGTQFTELPDDASSYVRLNDSSITISAARTVNAIELKGHTEIDSLNIGSYTMPIDNGVNNQVLTTNGAGIASWQNPISDVDWTIGSGTIYNLNDNVGIGINTPNPAFRLSLYPASGGGSGTKGGVLITNTLSGNRRKVGIQTIHSDNGNLAKFGYISDISGRVAGNDTLASFYSIIDNNNSGDTAYGLYSQFNDNTGENFGVFTRGEDYNFFSGSVGIGTSTPSAQLDIIGDVEIPAANDYTYSTSQTRYMSFSAAAFTYAGENSGVETYQGSDVPAYRSIDGGSAGVDASLMTSVQLPEGATVTNVEFYVYDNSNLYEVDGYMGYYTVATGGSLTNMATTNATGVAASSAGVQTISDNTISNAVIDNQNRGYFLRFETEENTDDLRLFGARITYEVNKTD